ncbi:ribokinase [Paenibacillus physcomitrellae]|uniref:Ribokinase n=1 Tax=Paenibacillus physcomitrellae TaxID=1619311 RepID=A0ABQ1GMC7_9BACL|nr:ribokinase [Paenibacillus physcomitrellae]GGA46255.1 ribokinase [Paenibacillus physcomitrellae]
MANIVVVGSSAVDLVVTASKRPGAGETVLGESFKTVPGGKGANQAVAAARLGAEVTMVGRVGDDQFADQILENFKSNRVSVTYVEPVTHRESGTAHIILAEGDNSIVVVKGANDEVTPAYISSRAVDAFSGANMVLIQQEIPEETVVYVSRLAKQLGIPLLLNPAPARPIPQEVIDNAAYITPNEHEAKILFKDLSIAEALRKYPNKLFITEGSNGVRYFDGVQEVLVPSYKVEVVDTTGAGDTFNAAFAVALAEGKPVYDSVRFANRAASLSVTRFGAQGGMPQRQEVEEQM